MRACVGITLDTFSTRTPAAGDAPTGPTKVPASSLYYKTTAGSYSISQWYPFQGSQHTWTCTGQDATVEMIIWIATGEIYSNASFSKFNEDCSLADSRSVVDFSGSMHDDGSRTYVRWDTCNSSSDWRASGTAVSDELINLLHLDNIYHTDDDVFIGGATCDRGDATDGITYSFDYTLYYLGEYKP